MKHKLVITQVITTELFVDANCEEDALEFGNQILGKNMIPLADYRMENGSVEVKNLKECIPEQITITALNKDRIS